MILANWEVPPLILARPFRGAAMIPTVEAYRLPELNKCGMGSTANGGKNRVRKAVFFL